MKVLYILIIPLFLSQIIFSMQLSSFFKIHLKNIPTYRQKRKLSSCLCVEKAKKDLLFNKYTECKKTIDENARLLNASYNFIKNSEKLQQENRWPLSEGLALEKELRSGEYCSNFYNCACKLEQEEIRVMVAGIVSGGTLFSSIVLALLEIGYVPTTCLGAVSLSTGLYHVLKINQLWEKSAALTQIADLNLHRLSPIYDSFIDGFKDASTSKKHQEFPYKRC